MHLTSHTVALMASAAVLPRLAPGAQFITGACTSDVDCQSGCCGFTSGKCAGAIIAQERDGGCGFGDAAPNNNAAQALAGANAEAAPGVAAGSAPAAEAAPSADTVSSTDASSAEASSTDSSSSADAASSGSGKPPGTQFITGVCGDDADCASGCCSVGKCAARLVATEAGGKGCGFGSATLGADAATATSPAPAAAAAPSADAASSGSGKPPGTQFITGVCADDGDCASGCCSAGKCAARLVATEAGGKGCGFTATRRNFRFLADLD
jgi:hypothetical protein